MSKEQPIYVVRRIVAKHAHALSEPAREEIAQRIVEG